MKKLSRPYFETEVVKVKKEKCPHNELTLVQDMPYRVYRCTKCGYYFYPPHRFRENKLLIDRKQNEGNWINGENLDKIKFPCFCSYELNDTKWWGKINKSWEMGLGFTYYLFNINKQDKCNMVSKNASLRELIKYFGIHIRKGKIIIFEEEK